MSKHLTKRLRRLEARKRDYETISKDHREGTRKPGSMNSHKHFSIKRFKA